MKSTMLRPYSEYLDGILNGKLRKFKYDLSGSSPPLPKTVKGIAIEYTEAHKSKAWPKALKQLALLYKRSPKNFVISIGSSGAFFQTLSAITQPGDSVLIEKPTYEPFIKAALFLGLKLERFNRTGNFQSDLKVLKKKKSQILILSNPQSPNGSLYSEKELSQISKHFKHVIVDEVFLPLFTGEMTRCSKIKNAIIISGLSKTLGLSSLRVGWISSLNPGVLRACDQFSVNFNIDLPTLPLVAASANLKNWKAITKTHRDTADKNRKLLQTFAKQKPGILSHDFEEGHFATMKIPAKFRSGTEFANALAKHSIKVCPTHSFELPNAVRISAMLPPQKFKAAFLKISSFY